MGTDEADDALSAWTAERTNGLIGADGKVLETTPDTLMVLASTLYAMGRWSDEFRAENNTDDVFTAADGTEQEAEFMHRTDDSTFLRREGYQAAYLYTTAAQVVFVLPDEGVSPRDLLADPDLLGSLDFEDEDAIYGEVQWSLPKFDVGSDLDLKSTLAGLGIASVLDPEAADFSPLTDTDPVWLNQAKQIARVKVDEQGIEAAAVTLLGIGCWRPAGRSPNLCHGSGPSLPVRHPLQQRCEPLCGRGGQPGVGADSIRPPMAAPASGGTAFFPDVPPRLFYRELPDRGAVVKIGAPAATQRSGRRGERRPGGGNELSGLPGSERPVAWADDVGRGILDAPLVYRGTPGGAPARRAPPFLPKEMGEKKGPGVLYEVASR